MDAPNPWDQPGVWCDPLCVECGALIDATQLYVAERVNEYRTRLFCNDGCRQQFYGEDYVRERLR